MHRIRCALVDRMDAMRSLSPGASGAEQVQVVMN